MSVQRYKVSGRTPSAAGEYVRWTDVQPLLTRCPIRYNPTTDGYMEQDSQGRWVLWEHVEPLLPRWVPVGERLPKKNVSVLAWGYRDNQQQHESQTEEARLCNDGWQSAYTNGYDETIYLTVTHWQKKPTGPVDSRPDPD